MMNAATLLEIWEAGLATAPVERIFLLLTAGYPEISPSRIGRLTLGEKEAHLLLLREQLFGAILECVVECRSCGQHLEFGFSAADINAVDYRPNRGPMDAGRGLTVSPLTLDDLRASGGSGRLLLARALRPADQEQNPVVADGLSSDAVSRVTTLLQELDPLMDIHLDLLCPGCSARWSAPFEAISYVWMEIEHWGAHILRMVHRLATAYGWSERDILAMSPRRRQQYAEMIP